MLIKDFNEFVKSIEDGASDDHVFVTEQEEETEYLPEVLAGDITDTCGLLPPDEERHLWDDECS